MRNDTRVGSEHLLLGTLMAAPDTTPGPSADDVRAALDQLERAALRSVGVDVEGQPPRRSRFKKGHIPFTGAAKDCLAQALKEAILLGDREIRAEHILLAITTLPASDRAIRALRATRVEPGEIRSHLISRMRRSA